MGLLQAGFRSKLRKTMRSPREPVKMQLLPCPEKCASAGRLTGGSRGGCYQYSEMGSALSGDRRERIPL